MKVLIVPDSFKGSFSAIKVVDVISDVLYQEVKTAKLLVFQLQMGAKAR